MRRSATRVLGYVDLLALLLGWTCVADWISSISLVCGHLRVPYALCGSWGFVALAVSTVVLLEPSGATGRRRVVLSLVHGLWIGASLLLWVEEFLHTGKALDGVLPVVALPWAALHICCVWMGGPPAADRIVAAPPGQSA